MASKRLELTCKFKMGLSLIIFTKVFYLAWFSISLVFNILRKLIQIDIRNTDSYSDSYWLFQVVAHSNPLLINDSYKKSLTDALLDL